MHIVKLGFELKSELHFFFMVLRVLRIVLLKFQSHLLFVHHFSLELFTHFLLGVEILLQHLLVVGLLLGFLLVVFVELLQLGLMLLRDLTNEHAIVCTAAVLEQDSKDFPNVGDH